MSGDTVGGIEGFAERLRSLIGEHSVSKFAQDVGLGDNLVRKYLEGSNPGADKLIQIADAKGVDLEWLATGRGDPHDAPVRNIGSLGEDATHRKIANELRTPYLPVDEEFVTIPYYDAKASAGLGASNGETIETKPFKFRRDWWMKRIGSAPEQFFMMEIGGDSMAPRLTDDHLPILQWSEEMDFDGIYVFRLDGEVFIKNLERRPGRGLIARSENPAYTPWEIGDGSTFGEFKIIGRVIRKMIVELP